MNKYDLIIKELNKVANAWDRARCPIEYPESSLRCIIARVDDTEFYDTPELELLYTLLERAVSIIEDLQDNEGYPVVPMEMREALAKYNGKQTQEDGV